jgi:hypothetical protein
MSSPQADTCFVISPFGEPFDTYFAYVIKPAVESCGLYAIRGDSLYRPTTIVEDIWTGIRDAKLLVAELSGRNPNVFYELGLAHAISKPVILLAETIDDVPFDLRAIRVLLYDKNHPDWGSLLQKSLTKAIREVMGSPTSAIPITFKTPIRLNSPEEPETLIRLEALEAMVKRIAGQTDTADYFPFSEEEEDEAANAPSEAKRLKVGQDVAHKTFGKGRVLEIEGSARRQRVKVNFERAGLKWIAQHVAKMQILSSSGSIEVLP